MAKIIKNHLNTIIPLSILIITITLRLFEPSIIQRERLIIFDIYQILQPRVYKSVPVNIIDIDDESLKKIGQWPWSRDIISQLINNLQQANVSAIGFDVVFAEQDKSSLHHTLPVWQKILPETEFNSLKRSLDTVPTHDEAMAKTISNAKVVLGFSFIQQNNNTKPIEKASISILGNSPEKTVLNYQGAVKNLDLFEKAATGNGSFNIKPEIDSIVRRLPLVYYFNGSYYPSLVLELLRVSQNQSSIIIKTQPSSDNSAIIENIKVGNTVIPTDAEGNLLVYYSQEIPQRTIPAWKVLENQLNAYDLKNHIVLIGTSAAGLKDQRPTPLNPFAPGIEIQTNGLEQVLLGDYLYRPDWLIGLEIIVMGLVGLLFIRFMPRLGSVSGLMLTLLFISTVIVTSWYAFKYYHWLVDPIYPASSISAIYFVILLLNYFKSETERKFVRDAFSHYISPALVEQLVQNSQALKLGGEMRDMSILFCDIRGFTSISEQLDAGQLTYFINQFLNEMTLIILNEKGTIDKYIGDCIMALWSAPLEDNHHAANACHAALKMLDALTLFNQREKAIAERDKRQYIEVHIGIGINSGICCVGNMGSDLRFDYSVLGDNVNLASRLEGQSKSYGVDIIISEYTLASIHTLQPYEQFAVLELDVIRVKGKLQPVRIYTVLGGSEMAHSEEFLDLSKLHHEMMCCYYAQNWQQVILLSERCRGFSHFALSHFYQLYQQRAESFLNTPPDSAWDGVYVAISK